MGGSVHRLKAKKKGAPAWLPLFGFLPTGTTSCRPLLRLYLEVDWIKEKYQWAIFSKDTLFSWCHFDVPTRKYSVRMSLNDRPMKIKPSKPKARASEKVWFPKID